MKNLLLISLCFIVLFSCDDDFNAIQGEGAIVEQSFSVDDFNTIILESAFDVRITQGNTKSVILKGQQNIIDRAIVKVNQKRLTLDLESGSYNNWNLEALITVPSLSEVRSDGSGDISIGSFTDTALNCELTGSGDIDFTGDLVLDQKLSLKVDGSGDFNINSVDTPDALLDLDGSGDVEVSGNTTNLEIISSGSGTLKAFDFSSDQCTINNNGSGDCKVKAVQSLNGELTGSGDIEYKGSPNINVTVTGSGELKDAN